MQLIRRRSFLKGSVVTALAAAQVPVSFAADAARPAEEQASQPLVNTPPTLQIPVVFRGHQ